MSKKKRKRDKQPAQSQATQRPVGTNQHEPVYDNRNVVHPRKKATKGNSNEAAERRLRKDRPDLYALSQLLRSDRKRTGGWVRLGKIKGAYA
jgi:hypothetical protein